MLEKSNFDFLTLELADFRLTIGTGAPASQAGAPMQVTAAPAAPAPVAATNSPHAVPADKPVAAAASPSASTPAEKGLIEVTATTMGRFYARPEPDAEPFVTVGSPVGPDDTVGLIEVMKLFNGVAAGVAGTVAEICVEDAQLVEFGQVLVRVRPNKGAAAS
jgi:acetyl-CoA carboxylase biotin carboxyl carrier protein